MAVGPPIPDSPFAGASLALDTHARSSSSLLLGNPKEQIRGWASRQDGRGSQGLEVQKNLYSSCLAHQFHPIILTYDYYLKLKANFVRLEGVLGRPTGKDLGQMVVVKMVRSNGDH
jgi:hypothetical protein